MSAETNFWVIPWKIILLVGTLLAGFLWFITWAIRLYVRKMLSLAGVSYDQTPVTLRVEKIPTKPSIVAPFEAGILDLRDDLEQTSSCREALVAVGLYVLRYWIFFFAVVVIIVFMSSVIWFIRDAHTISRNYSVILPETAEQLEVLSTDPTVTTDVSNSNIVNVAIVNRSGAVDAESLFITKLRDTRFIVSSSSNSAVVEAKTVIVYPSLQSEDAKELSLILNNALLSLYEPSDQGAGIIIYVGTDILDE
jgi:hypothetical protein